MKKIVIGIIVVLLAAGIYVTWQNRDKVVSAFCKAKSDLTKATFKSTEKEVLPGGLIKTTFQSTDKVGADIQIAIIAEKPMVLGSIKKKGRKTIAVFQPMKK